MKAPEGWQVKRFDELGTLWSGSTPSSNNSDFWDGEIVWITPTDLSRLNTPYIHDSAKRITERGLAGCSTHLLPPESIVLSSRAPIGYIAIPTTAFCTNQGCKSIELNDAFSSEFVYYAINFIVGDVKRLGEGTTFAEISKKALAGVELASPTDRGEQSKIAEVLSTVDRAIAQTEALIAKQQRIKTGLMQDLLTRGIDQHGQLRSEATHAFKYSPLGRIPVEWEVCPLERAVQPDSPITYGVVQPGKEDEYGVPFVRGGDIYQGEIDIPKLRTISKVVSTPYRRTLLKGGELLMSLVGYPGEVAVVAESLAGANIARQAALIRLSDHFVPAFVMCYLMSPDGKHQVLGSSLGSAQQVVNLKDLRTVVVPMPDVKEQADIAGRFAETFSQQTEAMRTLEKLRSLKTALMQDLLTGKVRVTPLLQAAEAASA